MKKRTHSNEFIYFEVVFQSTSISFRNETWNLNLKICLEFHYVSHCRFTTIICSISLWIQLRNFQFIFTWRKFFFLMDNIISLSALQILFYYKLFRSLISFFKSFRFQSVIVSTHIFLFIQNLDWNFLINYQKVHLIL